jgi:hypothetical protein
MGGRGLIDITRLHDKQVKFIQTYLLNKQVTSPLHAAAVQADDGHTPLDVFVQMIMNSPLTKNITAKSKDMVPKSLARPTSV